MSDVDNIFKQLDDALVKFNQEYAAEFVSRVAARTPVASGKLRDGWQSTVTPDEIVIANAVEYAGYVEFGTPYVAPRGMLRTTVLEAEQIAAVARQKSGLDK